MNREKLLQKISEILPVLREKYHVKEIGIFGSVARGEERDGSDVDVLVEFVSAPGFFDFVRLESFLSDFLGKKVDLISKYALKPLIREEILKEALYA